MSSTNILIIEDDALLAERLRQHLLLEGFTVAGIVETGQAALDLLKKQHIPIALVDIHLPGPENGILIAREMVKKYSVAVIYISGESSPEIFELSQKTYPIAFLSKPLNMRDVISQVKIVAHNLDDGLYTFPGSRSALESIHLPSTSGLIRLKTDEIAYIQAERSHSRVYLTQEGFQRIHPAPATYQHIQVWTHMGNIVEQLPWHFHRVSRSLTVNLNCIDLIESDRIRIGKQEITLPEGSRTPLLKRLNVVRTR